MNGTLVTVLVVLGIVALLVFIISGVGGWRRRP